MEARNGRDDSPSGFKKVPATSTLHPSSVPAAARATRILVAEDEPTLRRIVCRVLRAEGYEVIEAEDGEAAVVKFAADRGELALVVLDVRLPALSGPAAYARMVRDRAGLPVLFITGHAPGSEVIPRGSPLLMKPFTQDDLLRAVEDARGGASSPWPLSGSPTGPDLGSRERAHRNGACLSLGEPLEVTMGPVTSAPSSGSLGSIPAAEPLRGSYWALTRNTGIFGL